jgi:branched-chain amino acid transport system substrate-binding protein
MTPTRRKWTALLTAGLLVLAACGSDRDDDSAPGGGGGEGAASSSGTPETLIAAGDCDNLTQGVTASEIVLGLSHPESGLRAGVYKNIADGAKAYFDFVNAEKGGVKGRKIRLVPKDDAYEPGRTVAVVNELIEAEGVFGFFNNVGTPNNLAVAETMKDECIPNLLEATGFDGLADPDSNPFSMIANPSYSLESAIFVDHLKQEMPAAKIALLYQNDDFGKAYQTSLAKAIEGTELTVVAEASYEESDINVDNQMTTLVASGADVVFLGATGVQCANAMKASAGKGFAIRYVGGTCTATVILNLAGRDAVDGVLSTQFVMQPDNPANAAVPSMVEYKAKVAQYNPAADVNEGLVAYGWSQAAVLVALLEKAPELDRVSVMETAYHTEFAEPPGVFMDGVTWATDGAEDPFPLETQYLVQYDKATNVLNPVGEAITAYEGRSAETVKK